MNATPAWVVGAVGRWRGRASSSKVLGLLAVVLTILPFAYEAIATWLRSGYLFQGGDQATIELATRRAVHFAQLLGPYDRFGWDHPGPIYFYLLSVPYRLLGPGARPELFGEVVIGGLAAVGVVAVVYRRAGGTSALWSAAWVLFLCSSISALRLRYPWNPLVVTLPMVLLVVLAGAAMTGSVLCWIGAALVGSFDVQTDLSTAPITVLVLVVAAACLLGQRVLAGRGERLGDQRLGGRWRLGARGQHLAGRGQHLAGRPPGRTWILAGLGLSLLAALWIAPLVQELAGPGPGNLGIILRFFTTTHPHVSFSKASYAVAAVDSLLPFGPRTAFGQVLQTPAPNLVLLLTALVGVAAVGLGWMRRQWMAVSLGVLSLVGLPGSILAVTRIVGTIMGYLVLWVVALQLGALIGLGIALFGPQAERTDP